MLLILSGIVMIEKYSIEDFLSKWVDKKNRLQRIGLLLDMYPKLSNNKINGIIKIKNKRGKNKKERRRSIEVGEKGIREKRRRRKKKGRKRK